MYFEPTKKTYYRFPSLTSVSEYDSKHYYPEKPHASGEDMRLDTQLTNHVTHRESYNNF